MIRCATFRHICRFQQSLDPRLQICSCGEVQEVYPLGDDGDDAPWLDDIYEQCEPPTGVPLTPEEYALLNDEDFAEGDLPF